MQLTGDRFTSETAALGNDLSTLPDFPAEIRAPAGSLPGVSGFQLHFADHDILTPGDAPNVLVAMNPAALRTNLHDLPKGGTLIVNRDAFNERNLRKAGYTASPLEDGSLADYQLHDVALTTMTVEALCAAVMEYSDNTAANLLLATMGGPEGLTAYVRSLGDKVTRFDRKEPELNTGIPGDPRDTTTPDAMLASMRTVLLGEALTAESRAKLDGWLTRNTTGAAMIRAGVPSGWRVGDKTGRGGNASTNDIAIIRPPEGAPILLCVYSTESKAPAEEREAAVAEVARLVLEALGK